ncbi:unnamed protein product, partial [Prorocentrum cordatum]
MDGGHVATPAAGSATGIARAAEGQPRQLVLSPVCQDAPGRAEDVPLEDLVCSYQLWRGPPLLHGHRAGRPRPTSCASGVHRVSIALRVAAGRRPDVAGVDLSVLPPCDGEYRVIVRQPEDKREILPPASEDWEVKYVFRCPPIPSSATFQKHTHTLYVWGDLDFDSYGASGSFPIHPYRMNQIVPQVMIGNCLARSSDGFLPQWQEFDSWAMQAQYYWQTGEGEATGSRALCGEVVPVE